MKSVCSLPAPHALVEAAGSSVCGLSDVLGGWRGWEERGEKGRKKGVNIEFSKVSCVVKHFRCGCVLRSLSPGGGRVVRLCPTGKVLLIKHRHYNFL